MVKQMGIKFFCVSLGLGVILFSLLVLDNHLFAQASPGKLNKVHEQFEGPGNCLKCHTAPGVTTPDKCLSCHPELAQRIQAKKGFHADKPGSCTDCHQEHKGKDSKLSPLEIKDFDHNDTGFILQGAHVGVETCEICHNPGNSYPRKFSKSYLIKDNRCQGCHQDPHRGNQPNCIECHSTRDWHVDIW